MDYKAIFKKLSESDVVEDEIEATDPVEIEEILLGSIVKVLDASTYTPEDLSLTDEEFEEFKVKVDAGDTAIVFDEDDDNPELVDIVFEDGLEIFRIPKLDLELSEFTKALGDTEPVYDDEEEEI